MNIEDDSSIQTHLRSLISVKDKKESPEVDCHANDFGESACGEPLIPQHLTIDFTPRAEDTDFLQKKCCAFWDFITSCPELENFIVLPEPNISERKARQSDIELASIKISGLEQQAEPVKTAVSMIEFVEEKGLITRAFESKLPKSRCSIGSLNYFDEKTTSPRSTKDEVCTCSNKTCKTCNKTQPSVEKQPKLSSAVKDMCNQLRAWDVHHPKSMDPPGHPPPLELPSIVLK